MLAEPGLSSLEHLWNELATPHIENTVWTTYSGPVRQAVWGGSP